MNLGKPLSGALLVTGWDHLNEAHRGSMKDVEFVVDEDGWICVTCEGLETFRVGQDDQDSADWLRGRIEILERALKTERIKTFEANRDRNRALTARDAARKAASL